MSFYNKTFKIIGDQAYTEDDIIVNNLVVYIPNNATEEETLNHFKEFGEVSSYQWLEENKRKMCLISFCDSKDAAIVLEKYRNGLQDNTFDVHACESWQQPDGERIIKVLTELAETHDSSSSTDSNHKSLILTLNDDCLEFICKKLSTADQTNFALACQRFSGILKLLSRAEYRQLNADIFSRKILTEFQTKIFLLIVGPQVKILRGKHPLESFEIEMLGSYCTNVENLKLDEFYSFEAKNLLFLIEKMKFLKELWLGDYSDNYSDVRITYLESLTNLKKLYIKNSRLTGNYISNLCGLETLSFHGFENKNESFYSHSNIEPCYFKEICKNLTNLNYLDVTGCILLKTDDFEHILQNLLQLETLKLSDNGENITCIAQLPKLKRLSITQNGKEKSITEDFLQNLAKHQAHQLQELMFDCASDMVGNYIFNFCGLQRLSLDGCENIKPCHFKEICKNLTNLNYLDVTGCILLKTDDFEKILQHLLQLETLKLSDTGENINCIAQLPKLKQLSIDAAYRIGHSITEDFFQNLVKHQAHQLQELMLKDVISDMTLAKASLVSDLKNLKVFSCRRGVDNVNEFCLIILEGCLKLESLDLSKSYFVKPCLIPRARKILQKQRFSGLRTNCVHIKLITGRSRGFLFDDFLSENDSDVLNLTLYGGTDADDLQDYPAYTDEEYDTEDYDADGLQNYPPYTNGEYDTEDYGDFFFYTD